MCQDFLKIQYCVGTWSSGDHMFLPGYGGQLAGAEQQFGMDTATIFGAGGGFGAFTQPAGIPYMGPIGLHIEMVHDYYYSEPTIKHNKWIVKATDLTSTPGRRATPSGAMQRRAERRENSTIDQSNTLR